MAEHLFVYGTLRPGHAPAEVADVVESLRPIGRGTVKGTRYNLGEYPAIPRIGARIGKVQGEVFALPDDADTLRLLDAYEEFDPQDPTQSLFRRSRVWVTLADGSRKNCWVYLYNKPIPKLTQKLQHVRRSSSPAMKAMR